MSGDGADSTGIGNIPQEDYTEDELVAEVLRQWGPLYEEAVASHNRRVQIEGMDRGGIRGKPPRMEE